VSVRTITSREFNQDTSSAKKAAEAGPVIITDRGRPAHVLISFEEWRRLSGGRRSLAEALAHPESADVEFDPPRLEGSIGRPADLS
jgi:prevent-host-death family protein